MGKNGSSIPNANVEQLVMKVFISLVIMDNNLQLLVPITLNRMEIYLTIFYNHQLEFLQYHQKWQ